MKEGKSKSDNQCCLLFNLFREERSSGCSYAFDRGPSLSIDTSATVTVGFAAVFAGLYLVLVQRVVGMTFVEQYAVLPQWLVLPLESIVIRGRGRGWISCELAVPATTELYIKHWGRHEAVSATNRCLSHWKMSKYLFGWLLLHPPDFSLRHCWTFLAAADTVFVVLWTLVTSHLCTARLLAFFLIANLFLATNSKFLDPSEFRCRLFAIVFAFECVSGNFALTLSFNWLSRLCCWKKRSLEFGFIPVAP